MTIKEFTVKTFKRSGLSILDISLILAYGIKRSREFILAHPEFKISAIRQKKIARLIKLRKKGYPIAYLIGEKEFYGFKFSVNKHVLIPRPETELLVENAKSMIEGSEEKQTVIDIGTGSGCIIITLAKLLNQACPRPRSRKSIKNKEFIGIDISSKAITVARKNAKLHKVENNIKFLSGDLLEPCKRYTLHAARYMILANLPYLTPEQVKKSPSIKHEPKSALIAGPDGLKYYRKLFKQIKKYKLDNYSLLCEIDHTQTKNIIKLISQELPNASYEIKKDLGGYNRLVIITNEKENLR